MREALFKKQNLEKWKEIEEDSRTDNPDLLSQRYIELTDDLAYSKTFYPESPTTSYLNGLTSTFFNRIYANKKEKRNRFVLFWKEELPYLFYNSQKELAYSFIIFFVSCVIGIISTLNDNTFVRLILGDDYVDMTMENIAKGNPTGVYNSQSEISMFFAITINNIKVAFTEFVGGVTGSLLTIFALFRNGVMLGTFQTMFFQKNVGLPSVLAIWIHGTLEISAIVIAGCAGLVMGNSLLFPKTFSRLESFKRGARQGLKIAIGLVPVFIAAGFLESFITRKTLPPVMSCLIIGGSAIFMIWYFVLYPIQLHRKYSENEQ